MEPGEAELVASVSRLTTHAEFYEQVGTYGEPVERHAIFLEEYRRHARSGTEPLDVLDVGCGEHAVLARGVDVRDRYHGMDVKERIAADLDRYSSLDLNEEPLVDAFPGTTFDVIFCGEVIEHVFSPDRLLRQLASVMHDDSTLVLSTPNLAYWVNRLLLLAGINPLFVENSSEVMLGRRSKALGQGNATQGHIRLFTHRAMMDLLAREGWRIVRVRAAPVWNLPGDRLVCRFLPHLAPNPVYVLRRPLRG